VIVCREEEKFLIACRILQENTVKSIVFVETKRGVDMLFGAFKGEGWGD
jgi:superfamily II DNA/RNA helicase